MKKIRHLLEYIPIYLFYRLCRAMGFRRASNLGGFIGRHLGYWYALVTKVADKNIARVFPTLSPADRKKIIKKSADNFGRTFFEYFVLDLADHDPAFKNESQGFDKVADYIKGKRPIMGFSAHLGNWEMGAKDYLARGGALTTIYRTINNPYVNALVLKCRGKIVANQIPKGKGSGLASIRALKSGQHMVILVDQKFNEGIDIPFFGHPAKTADGYVKLAIAANAYLLPILITRHESTKFKVHYIDGIIDPTTMTVEECLLKVNHYLEEWIKAYPEQWFWFHRRWDKSFYKDTAA
jgi:KDO2-lipid IV(A) lauroyltransferase